MALRKKVASKKTSAKKGKAKKEEATEAPAAPVEAKPTRKRAPNEDYGYRSGAKISVSKEKSYSRKRGEVFAVLVACNGKTVETFEDKAKKILGDDPARGWLRFFVLDGACELSGGKEEAA